MVDITCNDPKHFVFYNLHKNLIIDGVKLSERHKKIVPCK